MIDEEAGAADPGPDSASPVESIMAITGGERVVIITDLTEQLWKMNN